MAMNKKEQAEREALLSEIARLKAWRLTDPVERDLMPPSHTARDKLTCGWDFNTHTLRVFKACSSSIYHGEGWERTSSQRPTSLFSTREKAFAAMRYEIEQQCLNHLAAIDRAAMAKED